MFLSPSGVPSPYLANLVGYYKFDSNGNDFSGNGHNGSIGGTPIFSSGKVGNAIDFVNNSNDNYVSIPHTGDFNFSNGTSDVPFTVSIWVKFHSLSGSNIFFNKFKNSSPYSGYRLGFEGTLYLLKYQADGSFSYRYIHSNSNPFVINTWYHVCYTDAGSGTEKWYVNGVEIAVTKDVGGTYVTMGTNTVDSAFGISNWNLAADINKHKGLIDESYIWKNRVLNSTEVLDIYNLGLSGTKLI